MSQEHFNVEARSERQPSSSTPPAVATRQEPARAVYTREQIHEKLALADVTINEGERWDGLS
jgi:hypothetical protein